MKLTLTAALAAAAAAWSLAAAQESDPAEAAPEGERIGGPVLPAPPADLLPRSVPAADRSPLLREIDGYLAELDVLQGNFFQIEPTGVVSQGQFWIDRPGRMRFEYADPHPFTLVADGATYTVWDRELDDVNTRVPLRETPLYMFLKRDVALSQDADIVDLTETPGELALTLRDRDDRVEGTLTLVFARPSLELRRFATTDGAGAETEVLLTEAVRGGNVDPALFVVREPRRRDRR
jgi:outer membrane lipoprotein-sorting protein